MVTVFRSLAILFEKVEATKGRLEIIDLAAEFLRQLEAEEVEPAVSMILGRAFPRWSQKTLDVSWATLSGVLQRLVGAGWSVFHEAFAATGDVGATAMAVFEKSICEEADTIEKVKRIYEQQFVKKRQIQNGIDYCLIAFYASIAVSGVYKETQI